MAIYANHNMHNVKIEKNNRSRRKDLLMRDRFNTDHLCTYITVVYKFDAFGP